MTRILGVDPGLQTTGFGVIDQLSHTRYQYVASGTITTTHLPRSALAERLKVIHEGITQIISRYQPQAAVAEIVFVNVNPQSTLLLGQARGAALSALAVGGLPVHEYTALQMKKSITGYGRASKSQIQSMIQHLLQLPGQPGPDAADALGLAITHALMHSLVQKLKMHT